MNHGRNYDRSVFFLRAINELYGGHDGMTKKMSDVYDELEQLMFEHGREKWFADFIQEINDNESLDEFKSVRDLNRKYNAHVRACAAAAAAAPVAPAAAAAAPVAPAAAAAAAAAPVAHAAAAAPVAPVDQRLGCLDCRNGEPCSSCKADERSYRPRSRGGKKKSHKKGGKKSHKKGGKKSHKKSHRRRH
jgi:hypothetical protein